MTPMLTYIREDGKKIDFSSEQLKAIEEMATILCCHTSGMHDPEHWIDGEGFCLKQKAEAFENLCKKLGINPKSRSREGCFWCNYYEEHGRENKGRQLRLFPEEQASIASDSKRNLK